MSEEKFGIENLKLLVNFGVTIGKTISKDLEDGKISLTEAFGLIPSLVGIPDLVQKKQDIINEAKDLSKEEVEELIVGLDGIIGEDIVATIEDALSIIIGAKNLIERYK